MTRWLLRSAVRRDRHRVVGCRLGFDPVENRAGRFELESGALLAAARAEGVGETGPRQRRLVWRPDLAPKPRGFGAEPLCVRRSALCESHPPVSMGCAGDQRPALEPSGHASQLVGGRARSSDVAGRDLDLDLRLEQWRALQIGVRRPLLEGHAHRMLERVSDRRGRGGYVPLGEPHERETGLRIPAGAMSGQKRFLGAFDVSPAKPDPPELAQRPSHLAAQIRAQFLARAERLCLCRAARPAQPEDLRAVHAAAPVKAPDRIRPAPPLHRLGPFLGRVVLRESLQGAYELAVDDPGRERVEIPGDRRHPNLVEQREALLDITVEDQQPCFCHSTEGARRRVKPRTQLDGPPRPRSGAGQVAGQHALIRPNHRKPSARRCLGLTVQEPLGSCQPAPHRRHQRGIEEQVHRHANRRTCRRVLVAGLHAQRVSALPRLDGHVEMPRRVGDLAKDP